MKKKITQWIASAFILLLVFSMLVGMIVPYI